MESRDHFPIDRELEHPLDSIPGLYNQLVWRRSTGTSIRNVDAVTDGPVSFP